MRDGFLFLKSVIRLLVVTVPVLIAAVSGHAATFTVNSLADTGDGTCDSTECTLREALTAANGTGGANSIDFSVTGILDLNGALPPITHALIINGPGSNQLTIRRSSGGDYRIFTVLTNSPDQVTISGLTVTQGLASGNFPDNVGGAVANLGSGTLNISDCLLNNNSADEGGAIANYANSLDPGFLVNIQNSVLSNNTAFQAGAIWNDANMTIAHSSIDGNVASSDCGGGIASQFPYGSLTVTDSTISNNSSSSFGGGICNQFAALTILRSTISENSALGSSGGGISTEQGDVNISNSTFAANTTGVVGGAINNSGPNQVNISNTTIARNSANQGGAGIYSVNSAGSLHLKSTILALNLKGATASDAVGTVNSEGFNILGSSNGTTIIPTTGDQINISEAQLDLGPLQDNGGPTETIALGCNSAGIDSGINNSLTTDQRGPGFVRTVDDPVIPNLGDATDAGAFEVQVACSRATPTPTATPVPTPTPRTTVVTNTNDSGFGSLRQALADAVDGETIPFNLQLPATITLTTGELVVDKNVTVAGPGANLLAVDGNHAGRVIHITPGQTAAISGITIQNGTVFGGFGSGVFNERGTMILSNCAVTGNTADGGISNMGGPLTISNCSITGNAAAEGGGILNVADGGDATVTISNSTISGNSANVGGGIYNVTQTTSNATVRIDNSTIYGNSSQSSLAGGVFNSSIVSSGIAVVTLRNTVLKKGSLGENIRDGQNANSTVTSLGYNLCDDTCGGFMNAEGDKVNTDPLLGPLQNNGGPTFTHALLPGSPAIDAGDPNFAPPPNSDQRGPGFSRVINGRIDIGAFEEQTPPSITQQIRNVITTVSSSTLSAGLKTALTAKLQAANKAIDARDLATACGDLQDFIDQVRAQKKKIPSALADSLIGSAMQIQTELGCGGFALAPPFPEQRSWPIPPLADVLAEVPNWLLPAPPGPYSRGVPTRNTEVIEPFFLHYRSTSLEQ